MSLSFSDIRQAVAVNNEINNLLECKDDTCGFVKNYLHIDGYVEILIGLYKVTTKTETEQLA